MLERLFMSDVVISGTGIWAPEHTISNEELVDAFNAYVSLFNDEHAAEIAAGKIEPLRPSSADFILQASGIRRRYALDKSGPLDPRRMVPNIKQRGNDELSHQAEAGLAAAKMAMEEAKCSADDIDLVIVGCSSTERPYPAISIEIQEQLGIQDGFAYDMNVACSSATFAIQNAVDALRAGHARRALVLNPEITSGHNNFALREYHFIFGDACTAVLLETDAAAGTGEAWEVLGTRLATVFSKIRRASCRERV